jgi:hypothetical protein
LYFGIGSPELKEEKRTDRLTPAGRYEGMVDTIVQLFRVYASGVMPSESIRNLVHLGMKAPLLVPGIAEMDEDPMDTKESFSNSICQEQMQMAEHELSAFIGAVKELFGPDQAQLSAVDWLDELEMDIQPGSTSRDWQTVTIAASAQLANRLKAGPHDRKPSARHPIERESFSRWGKGAPRNSGGRDSTSKCLSNEI